MYRVRGHYPSFIAHMTSCDRPNPSHRLRPWPWSAGPCRLLPAPAGRWPFPTLSPHVFPWVLGPLSRRFVRCSYPFLPPQHRPSLTYRRSALPQLLSGSNFRDCSHFVMFGPPSLLAIQVVPTSEILSAGRPWLLHPSRTYAVTDGCIGYASPPNRAIEGAGTSTPQDSRPCRPLR